MTAFQFHQGIRLIYHHASILQGRFRVAATWLIRLHKPSCRLRGADPDVRSRFACSTRPNSQSLLHQSFMLCRSPKGHLNAEIPTNQTPGLNAPVLGPRGSRHEQKSATSPDSGNADPLGLVKDLLELHPTPDFGPVIFESKPHPIMTRLTQHPLLLTVLGFVTACSAQVTTQSTTSFPYTVVRFNSPASGRVHQVHQIGYRSSD